MELSTTRRASLTAPSAFQANFQALANAFVTKSAEDYGYGIAVDENGSAYVAGYTKSRNFPTVSPFQATNKAANNSSNVFATKLTPAGDALVYSTYLGASVNDYGYGIAVDGNCSGPGNRASASIL